MLKFIFMIFFLVFLIFKNKNYWLVQNFIFIMTFIFMLNMNLKLYFIKISYFLGMDLISYGLILLSLWICSLMLMSSEKIYLKNNNYNFFLLMILFLLMMLFLTFSCMNLFIFYLFFESSLIPTFFLILGWGYQPERMQAGFYLLFYTLFASLPLLIGILYCKNIFGSVDFYLMENIFFMDLLYFCLVMAFLVKMPMFFVHLWLPKAHVEAPVSGSMILAGVLLKLGGYGLLRSFMLIQTMALKFNLVWYVISLVGGVLISLVCLMQVDMKSLIAYSSVAHMGMVIAGLMTMSHWGFIGSYLMMLGHGLCSSGLFCLLNIIYERTSSRSLFINKGLLHFMPSLTFWWFLLCSSNMSAPPSLNLLGEIMLINSVLSLSTLSMILLSLVSFFSASYSLYLFAYSQHGLFYNMNMSFSMSNFREYMLMFLHWFPLNFLVLKPDFFSLWI